MLDFDVSYFEEDTMLISLNRNNLSLYLVCLLLLCGKM